MIGTIFQRLIGSPFPIGSLGRLSMEQVKSRSAECVIFAEDYRESKHITTRREYRPIHACDVEESIKRAHIMQYGFHIDRCLGEPL